MASIAELQAWQADVTSAQASLAARVVQITNRSAALDVQIPVYARAAAYWVEKKILADLLGHLAHLQKLATTRQTYLVAQIALLQASQPSPASQLTVPTSSATVNTSPTDTSTPITRDPSRIHGILP